MPEDNVENGITALQDQFSVFIPAACRLSFFNLQKTYALDSPQGEEKVIFINVELLRLALELLADRVVVDEAWYRKNNPDIDMAIFQGKFHSAKHHYIQFGYFENRIPHFVRVDDEYYFQQNIDIAAGVRSGNIVSCQWHFEKYGFKEGRLPFFGWTLL